MMTKDKCKNCFTVKVDGECPKCGRPVKYTEEEIVSIAAEYLSECKTSAELPTIAGLAVKAEIGRNTLYDYAKDYNTTFSNIFEKLMSEQEKVLVNKGLTGDYNSTIAKLILTKHGYSDKQDIDLSEKTFEHIRKQRDKYSK